MNVRVRWEIDLSGIYIKEKATSGKIPTHVSAESSTVGSISHRRMWETGSRKNLMKACLVCRSVRSVSWTIKKTSTQAEVIYDEHILAKVTSKSSFLLEEPERRISRGNCRGIGPRRLFSMYILGLRPKPRTRGCPRRSKHCQGSSC